MSKVSLATTRDVSDLQALLGVLRNSLTAHAAKSHASVHQNVEGIPSQYEDVYDGIIGQYTLRIAYSDEVVYIPCTIVVGDIPPEVPADSVIGGGGDIPIVKPYFVIQPSSASYAAGQTVSLSVGVAGSTPIAYQWQKNAVDIFGATEPNYVIDSFQSSSAGTYTCVATNGGGSTTSSVAVLTLSI